MDITALTMPNYVVSGHEVEIGTANFDWSAFHKNQEYLEVTTAPAIVKSAQMVFGADWNHQKAGPYPHHQVLVLSPGSAAQMTHLSLFLQHLHKSIAGHAFQRAREVPWLAPGHLGQGIDGLRLSLPDDPQQSAIACADLRLDLPHGMMRRASGAEPVTAGVEVRFPFGADDLRDGLSS